MAISVASRMPNSVCSSVTVSPTRKARAWASVTGISKMWCAMAASDEGNAARRDQRRGAPRRMALDVHGDRIHGDVGRRDLDMDAERGGSAAEPLRADAELVDGLAQLRLDLAALGFGAGRPARPGRRDPRG